MSHDTTFTPSCPPNFSGESPLKRLATAASPISLTSTLAKFAAASLVTASAGLGAVYAWGVGNEHGIILGALFVLCALGLEVAKPLSVVAAFKALGSWQFVRGGVLSLLATVAIAYSLSAELSLVASTRGDVVAERQAALDTSNTTATDAKRARDRYEAASKELGGLAPSRPAAEVQAEIEALLLTPGADGCTAINGKVTAKVCPQVATLKIEKARADRRAELEATILTPPPVIAPTTTQSVKDADPGASALSTYLAALGIVVPVALLTDWLALVPVIALELGSALAGVLVQAVSWPTQPGSGQTRRSEKVLPAEPEPVAQGGSPSKSEPSEDPAHVREKVKNAILDQLKKRGGEVAGSERGLAALIGASRPTLRRAINGLALAGIVAAEATRNGTVLRLTT